METGFRQKSIADALFETHFETKVASEQWLKLGRKEYRLIGKSIRLGRALDNDIVLEDKSCSRYHALISITPEGLLLQDLKSRNGIRVNGRKTKRALLKNNDKVEIGDLRGIFLQRVKEVSKKQKQKAKEDTHSKSVPFPFKKSEAPKSLILKFKDFFENLSPKKKLLLAGSAPLFLFVLFVLFRGSHSAPVVQTSSQAAQSTLKKENIVDVQVNKEAFSKCLEFEDLGNFKQARKCFGALPLNKDVYEALNRVTKRQNQLTTLRYQEGANAFANYYYDMAIIKWQEVLLIADDSSQYLEKAKEGIANAMERKKLL